MNILIVEDEKLAVRKLTKLLEETAPEFKVQGITPSIAATVEWIMENRDGGNPEPGVQLPRPLPPAARIPVARR